MKKRTKLDWSVLGIVVLIAIVIIALSFGNTAKLAGILGLNPYLTAGLVEILFGALLFLRGRQRATQRNVPIFLEIGYFVSLGFVTAINMWGLAQESPVIGSIVGLAISGAMWLMENTLVWLWTKSHEPHKQTAKDLMREAKREIKEEKAIQRIEWMKWESRKPDLQLIKEARKADEKREEVTGDGLPEFFNREPEPVEEVVVTPIPFKKENQAEVIPMRQIGFQMEQEKPQKKSATKFKANTEAREKAIQTAKELQSGLGRIPTKKELMGEGLTEHYSKFAIKSLKH